MPINQDARPAETLNAESLQTYLRQHYSHLEERLTAIQQFRGGYSNLTYRLDFGDHSVVLRRPPFGPRAAKAHDIAREFHVLSALRPVFAQAPRPLHLCTDEAVIGAPFYLMEFVPGTILRANQQRIHQSPPPEVMKQASQHLITTLAKLHQVPLGVGLLKLGHSSGYVQRQVEGWIQRFERAKTKNIGSSQRISSYLLDKLPEEFTRVRNPALIHNDYKFDNLVFADERFEEVKAILDWEMCTVGDPMMDLGLTLAYWAHPEEVEEMPFLGMNQTHLAGCLRRPALVAAYSDSSGTQLPDMLYYYIFGNFKIAGIVQQIYARYVRGHTRDERFADLGQVVNYLLLRAERALASGTIG